MEVKEPNYGTIGRGAVIKHCKALRALLKDLLPHTDEAGQKKIREALTKAVPIE